MTQTGTLSLAPQSVSTRIKRAGFAVVTGDRSRPGVHITGGKGRATFVNVIADEQSSRIAAQIANLLTDAGYKVNHAGRSMTLAV